MARLGVVTRISRTRIHVTLRRNMQPILILGTRRDRLVARLVLMELQGLLRLRRHTETPLFGQDLVGGMSLLLLAISLLDPVSSIQPALDIRPGRAVIATSLLAPLDSLPTSNMEAGLETPFSISTPLGYHSAGNETAKLTST
jgi:hypothetical protein